MVDEYLVFTITAVGVLSSVASVIGVNFWNSRTRKDNVQIAKDKQDKEIEKALREKFDEEKQLAKDLLEQNEKIVSKIKDDLRDYIDKGDLNIQRELAYAVKLLEKDIKFIQQFIFGKESKSMAAYTRGETETAAHDEAEGEGIFKDTQEESEDRAKRDLEKT